jgi:hypothetical protein
MIKDFLLDLMKGAVDGVKKFFGIHSPSRKMRDEVGKRIPEGMALGIKDKAKAVADAMDELEEIPKVRINVDDFDPKDFDFDPRGNGPHPAGGAAGGATYIINVNQPVSTPDEMARAIRTQSQYGLIEGAPV